ncbi:Predicted hydrolase [hydrothermal vent metagenome]|uniref:Predicted hydrolase n=1 Tax=hydrothermal vent metagenome TaxID=652676 RepID=A0A1W1CNM4_9ZZZZ
MSDHGQEFYEHGYYGHNSAYDMQQARCTFIFKDQNETKPEVVHHMTSHLDVVPTLMKRLGVTNPYSDYSHGENLFDKNYKRGCSFVGNWNENAIICKDNTFIISDIVTKAFDNQIRDTKSYKPVKLKDKSELNRVLMESLKQNSRFSH